MIIKASLTKDKVAALKATDEEKFLILPDDGIEAEIDYPIGETLDEMLEIIPKEVVRTKALGHIKFTIQGMIRNFLEAGLTQEEIQAKFHDGEEFTYIPTVGKQKKSRAEKEEEYLKALEPDQRQAEIDRIQAMLASLQAE